MWYNWADPLNLPGAYSASMSKKQSAARSARPASAPPPTETQEQRRADRQQARIEKQQAVHAAAARRQRLSTIRTFGLIGGLLLIVGGLIAGALVVQAGKPGESVPQQASPHIASITAPHAAYTTDPPTSGPHVPEVPAWGVATTPVPKELQVHGLEDAGVIISYRPDLDTATRDKLMAITSGYAKEVILTPAPGLSHPIVLTAWTRIQRMGGYDEAAIRRFIDAYRGIDHHAQSGS